MSWKESGLFRLTKNDATLVLLDDLETEDDLKVSNDWHAHQRERFDDSL